MYYCYIRQICSGLQAIRAGNVLDFVHGSGLSARGDMSRGRENGCRCRDGGEKGREKGGFADLSGAAGLVAPGKSFGRGWASCHKKRRNRDGPASGNQED